MDEYITATEATKLLGISQNKMAEMLRDGVLVWIPDPFNRRAKLIKRGDVEALLARAPRKPRSRRRHQPEQLSRGHAVAYNPRATAFM